MQAEARPSPSPAARSSADEEKRVGERRGEQRGAQGQEDEDGKGETEADGVHLRIGEREIAVDERGDVGRK